MPTATVRSAADGGLDLFYKAILMLGVSLREYLDMGGTVAQPPVRLMTPEMETHAWVVDRGAVDAALLAYRSRPAGSGHPRPEWKHVSSTPESEIHLLDPDCLTAWAEVEQSGWYRRLQSQSTPTPIPTPTPPPSDGRAHFLALTSAPTSVHHPTTPAPATAPTGLDPRHPRPHLSPHAATFTPAATSSSTTGEPSSRDLIGEQKVEDALLKLVNKLPKFPSEGDLSEDDKVNQLEVFSRKVQNLLDNKLVMRACRQTSCTGEGYITSVPDIMWIVAEECLRGEQREFVEKAAGGVGTSAGWMQRYADADIFFGDLALSLLAIEKLQKLRDGLTRRQSSKETANAYHSRLSARQRTVNFLAKVVPGCVPVSDEDFGHHFWRGLVHHSKVGLEMRRVNLDLNDPREWEDRARAEGHSRGVTSAVLKVLEFASDIEASKASKAADAASRRAPAPSVPFWQQRRGRALNALTESELELAAASTPPPPPGLPLPAGAPPGLPAPETRECYACGRRGHLVRDCKDAAKLAAWKANAPKRLSRDRRQVAAMFFAMAHDEDVSWAPAELRGEVEALAAADVNAVLELAALTDCTDLVEGIIEAQRAPPAAGELLADSDRQ